MYLLLSPLMSSHKPLIAMRLNLIPGSRRHNLLFGKINVVLRVLYLFLVIEDDFRLSISKNMPDYMALLRAISASKYY